MLCTNCDQPIEPDDGGAIWYHPANMSAFCDGDDEPDLARQAEPVSPANRVVYYTNESFFEPDTRMYVVAQITENEAGYGVWSRHETLEAAQAVVGANNGLLEVSDDDVLTVVMSSMRMGNRL